METRAYKNIHADPKDRTPCIHIMYAEGPKAPERNGDWIECEAVPAGLTHLYTVAGTRYYGRM